MRENVRKPLNLGGSAHSAVIRGLDPAYQSPAPAGNFFQ
jgi:hypothetical protein